MNTMQGKMCQFALKAVYFSHGLQRITAFLTTGGVYVRGVHHCLNTSVKDLSIGERLFSLAELFVNNRINQRDRRVCDKGVIQPIAKRNHRGGRDFK